MFGPTIWPRSPSGHWSNGQPGPVDRIDDVILGCANQAGEDNRNVARMAALLAGLPVEVPGQTVNRLCGSGLQAVVVAPPTPFGPARATSSWPAESRA